MKKLLINRKPVDGPWGGGNHFVRAIFQNAERNGYKIVTTMEEDIDVILVVDPRYDNLRISINEIARYKLWFPNTKIVHRVNECDKRKGVVNDIDPLLLATSEISDVSIFVSHWLEKHHRDHGWKCEKTEVIHNGVNISDFPEMTDQRPLHNPIRLVTHHWSNNEMKGFDIYDQLDQWVGSRDDFTFTYIGRERGSFKNTKVIKPLFGSALGTALADNDVYISASRWEPGPNHIVEGLVCGLPTFAHVDGGGSVEMVGETHTYDNFDELVKILESKKYKMNEAIDVVDWSVRIDEYFEVLNSVTS